jgi:uncharacterized protein YsxB (DUF464 family)
MTMKKLIVILSILFVLTGCQSVEYIVNENVENCAFTSDHHLVDETLVIKYFVVDVYRDEIEKAVSIWNEMDMIEFKEVDQLTKANFSFVIGETDELVSLEHITYDYESSKIYLNPKIDDLNENERINVFLKSFGLTLGLINSYEENIMFGGIDEQITVGKRDEEAYYCLWYDYKNQ